MQDIQTGACVRKSLCTTASAARGWHVVNAGSHLKPVVQNPCRPDPSAQDCRQCQAVPITLTVPAANDAARQPLWTPKSPESPVYGSQRRCRSCITVTCAVWHNEEGGCVPHATKTDTVGGAANSRRLLQLNSASKQENMHCRQVPAKELSPSATEHTQVSELLT